MILVKKKLLPSSGLFSITLLAVTFANGLLPESASAAEYLETIVVTAQRDETLLRDVTQSATVIDSESLQRINADHMHQLVQQTAGAWLSRGSGQEHLTAIRSPVFTGAGACGAFQMSQEGIPLRASGFCNANQLFDSHYEAAAAVEIQRGPKSALYGSNALFGAIDVRLPNAMSVERPVVSFDASSQNFYRINLAAPFAVSADKGWLALATFTDNTDERFSAGYQQQKLSLKRQASSGNRQTNSSFNFTHLDQQTAGYIMGEDAYKDDQLRLENNNPEAYRKSTAVHGSHRWQWQDKETEWAVTPYFRYTDMEFLMHFVPWQPVEKNSHGSLGVQAQAEYPLSSSLLLRSGVDIEVTQAELSELQNDEAPFAAQRFPVGMHYDYSVAAQAGAIYSGLEWLASERWLFNANVRGDYQRYDYQTDVDAGSACEPSVEGCRFYRPADRDDAFSNLSMALGSRYLMTPSHLVFANMASGFRAPQATELYRLQQGQEVADLESVKLNSIELGGRGSISWLNYQAALFYMEMENGVFQDTNRANISGSKTQHKGVEYELTGKFLDNLTLQLVGSFAEHKYSNNPNLLGSPSNIKGNFVDTAPKTMHSAVLSWQLNSAITSHVEVSQMDEYFLDPENTLTYEGHTVANVRGTWSVNASFTLKAAVLNMFDSRYADRADVAFGEQRYFPGQSRHGMLTLIWRG